MQSKPSNQNGGVIVLVAVSMVALLGFAALAVDVGHLMVARNELQNAADAGAIAGAQVLYNDNGTEINTDANQEAFDIATANNSEKVAVDVNWNPGENVGSDVERGHWSFGWGASPRGFYPSNSTIVIDLPGRTDEELDAMDGVTVGDVFVNAVRVVARRQAVNGTPILSFFARIFGFENFELSAAAVAYRGFSGTLLPGDIDVPIAICEDSMPHGDCTIGRMINSGQNDASHGTGGWTDFNQDNPCSGGTNANDVRDLVGCEGEINPEMVIVADNIATTGGEVQSAFADLYERFIDPVHQNNCASNVVYDEEGHDTGERYPIDCPPELIGCIPDGIPDVSWEITVPRISCPDNNVGPCEMVTGAITINVVWMTDNVEGYVIHDADGINIPKSDAPTDIVPDHMDDWSNNDPDAYVRWQSFLDHFGLRNMSDENGDGEDDPAPFDSKSIYFHPICEQRDLAGVSGGEAYGVLARIPVLVD